jgi:hypothetical protein
LIAELSIADEPGRQHGVVLAISWDAVLFRPAAMFIAKRRGCQAELVVEGITVHGTIVLTSPKGYEIRLSNLMAEEQVQELVAVATAQTNN